MSTGSDWPARAVDYQVMDPQGNLLATGTADLTDLGGFDLAFTLPVNSNLGYASIQLRRSNIGRPMATATITRFQMQEFRRPEFEVTARNETTGPYYLGDDAIVAVSAQYYAGGPLPDAETTWTVSASPTTYSPPNWPDFIFGDLDALVVRLRRRLPACDVYVDYYPESIWR